MTTQISWRAKKFLLKYSRAKKMSFYSFQSCFYQTNKVKEQNSGAWGKYKISTGQIWRAGRMLCMPDLNLRDPTKNFLMPLLLSPTMMPRHKRVPWTGTTGAVNYYKSLIFMPISLSSSRDVALYLQYLLLVFRFLLLRLSLCNK